jgi:hypothetical protein
MDGLSQLLLIRARNKFCGFPLLRQESGAAEAQGWGMEVQDSRAG